MKTKAKTKKKTPTKSAKSTNQPDREYPQIDYEKEVAVIAKANGRSLRDIGLLLNKHHTTIENWLKEPTVKECLDTERNKIITQAKEKVPRLVDVVYTKLLTLAESDGMTFRDGVSFLKDTGFLVTTKEKAESDRRVQQLADQLYNELVELSENQ